jgi:undecaprenyl diphosphate synthase
MSSNNEQSNYIENQPTEMSGINVPRHVAVIMDGNGRWAQERGLKRMEGHIAGVESLRTTIKEARKSGVQYLTVYAFSTENWGRPSEEVNGLMSLFCKCLEQESEELNKQGVKLTFIGQRDQLDDEIRQSMEKSEKLTETNNTLNLIIAFNYSARCELTSATKKIAQLLASGKIDVEQINDQLIEQNLYTFDIPDPDLIIRTSGECRLSNFLLWQAAYAEFYFTSVLWPDFDQKCWKQAMENFSQRKRRFGLVESKL